MTAMGLEDAQILALRALAHVLDDRRTRDALLVQSGIDSADLRRLASSPDFLAGLLAFLLDDERRAQSFCMNESVDPSEIRQAQAVLSGRSTSSDSLE